MGFSNGCGTAGGGEEGALIQISQMLEHPTKLPGFVFREPDDNGDIKLLRDIREHGWHLVGIPDDEAGPGFAYTVGLYLRTLQPEVLIMGVPLEPSFRILNGVAQYLMGGGTITPDRRYSEFVDSREVLFRAIHPTQMEEYFGSDVIPGFTLSQVSG
jgi:hypothetical protein